MAKKITPLQWFVILTLICVILALGLPPNQTALKSLDISPVTYRVALVTLLVPYIIIWYSAFYAYSNLNRYVAVIKKSKDGQAFYKITLGMGLLAFGLIIPTMVGLALNSVADHYHGWTGVAANTSIYLNLAFALPAFVYIGNGAHSLAQSFKAHVRLSQIYWVVGAFIILNVMFTFLTIRGYHSGGPGYHMSIYQLLLTVVAPFVFLWYAGIISVVEFFLYFSRIKGTLYRRFFRQFAIGIAIVVFGSIAEEFANNTIGSTARHSLNVLLLADYALLIIIAAGLITMALSTKNLTKIEKV